jgi:uncharacterized protein (TIGR03435 family)
MNLRACVTAGAVAALVVALPAAQERPAFEAATIKPAPPGAMRTLVAPATTNRLYIPSMTLTGLIYAAYGDGGFNTSMGVRGGPDWANRTPFTVEAVAAGRVTPGQVRLMLQTLLEERFALTIRRTTEESETNNVLGLVVDRSDGILGPKVTRWDGTCPPTMPTLFLYAARRPFERVGERSVVGPAATTDDPAVTYCPTGYRAGGLRVDGATMVTVAELLSLPSARALLGMFTQDRTGLTERYTMDLDYPGLGNGLSAPAAAAAEFAGPSLATAVREQWGLRLVPSKGLLKLVVIESAQLPTGN